MKIALDLFMPKTGDIDLSGNVFICKNNSFKSGEYWMPMDKFLLKYGADFYEKKARAKANKKALLATKERIAAKRLWELEHPDEVAAEKNKKEELKRKKISSRTIKHYHATKHLTVQKRKEARDKSYTKMLLDTVRMEKYKAKQERSRKRYSDKQKAITAIKKAKRDKEREVAKRLQQERIEAKRIEKEKRSVALALVNAMRPKRVVLTDEQRKERRRIEKQNYKHRRRAILNNCDVRATPKMIDEAKKRAGDRCYYCGRKGELTLDHFEPLAKGGAHCVSNFVFACFTCNSRKRDLDPFEFMASNIT